jgi:hypothetical protein
VAVRDNRERANLGRAMVGAIHCEARAINSAKGSIGALDPRGRRAGAGRLQRVPIPPAYTREELATRCWRTGGWWRAERPDSLISGHCEYRD